MSVDYCIDKETRESAMSILTFGTNWFGLVLLTFAVVCRFRDALLFPYMEAERNWKALRIIIASNVWLAILGLMAQ